MATLSQHGSSAALPFGKAVRERAVQQATAEVERKLRGRAAGAKAKSAT